MAENNDELEKLMEKLELIAGRQKKLADSVNTLYAEIKALKSGQASSEKREEIKPSNQVSEEGKQTLLQPDRARIAQPELTTAVATGKESDWEKFIGENIINKIGIAITIIGVGIGAKYSIEHDLISPLTRIILGYLIGAGLLAFGIKLKQKYTDFSAVLVSGALAIMYFVTYLAYDLYALIPQMLAFAIMVIFTIFTAIAAISYSRQVIALIGLVGAYAVPFLLSNNSGRVHIFFSYIAIINTGILFLAFRQYWKNVSLAAFLLTWLIAASWYLSDYDDAFHFVTGLSFTTIFYLIFYTTFLAYKLIRKEVFDRLDVGLIIANSFIYFALGYDILDGNEAGAQYLGLFALCNAMVHFIAGLLIQRNKAADRNLFYLVLGLVLVCITIAIPIQLDGNWVTLLWSGEAVLLFWIGRSKNVPFYERLSYPLIFLAFFSLAHDWMIEYGNFYQGSTDGFITPFLNIHFLTSLSFIAALSGIMSIQQRHPRTELPVGKKWFHKFIAFAIPTLLLSAIYISIRVEMVNYWDQLFENSALTVTIDGMENYYRDDSLKDFKRFWIVIFSLFFFSMLAILNMRKIRSTTLAYVNMLLIVLLLLAFLQDGLSSLASLRDTYIQQHLAEYYHVSIWYILLRYIGYLLVVFALLALGKYVRQDFVKMNLEKAFDATLHITLIWLASSELIHITAIADPNGTYDLGLSILWGIYALTIVAIGIRKKKKHLRIGAIAFFGITLLKLFIFDIAHLSTIAKTVVFLSLGVLLLIVSFLYNKFKNIISDDPKD